MKFKSLSVFLSLLIITVLPFTAYADDDPVGPAHANKGEEVVATNNPYYATAEPTVADQGHIATTAYVKGAYNDAIAAINKVNALAQEYATTAASNKQDRLFITGENNSVTNIGSEVATHVNNTNRLVTANAVNDALLLVQQGIMENLANKRVEIYTTWGGNGTAEVAFVSANAKP